MADVSVEQRTLRTATWILVGIVALGALLGALSDATAIVTPNVSTVGTITLVVTWLLAQIWMRRRQSRWRTSDGSQVRLRSWGSGTTAAFVGMIALLWYPRARDWYFAQQTIRSNAAQRAPLRVNPKNEAAPSLEVGVFPSAIAVGASAELRWSSRGAAEVLILPRMGFVANRGSRRIVPERSTTYVVAAVTRTGTVTIKAATVHVHDANGVELKFPLQLLSGSIGASPSSFVNGKPPRLSWLTFDATDVAIVPTIGLVTGGGEMEVFPEHTTTFTMILSNQSGASGDASATVYVHRWPAPPSTR